MNNQALAMIVANPGQLRDSLHVLLRAVPCIDQVLVFDHDTSVQELHANGRPLAAGQPLLALMDFASSEAQTLTMLQGIKEHVATSCCIVLVNSEQESATVEAAGADLALIKGVSAAKLFATVEEVLQTETCPS